MIKLKNIVLILFLSGIILCSCKTQPDFEIKNFHPFVNWNQGNTKDTLFLDYQGSIDHGFVIPSITQTAGGKFLFKFDLKNLSRKNKKFKYKIYYQNESYKMPEYTSDLIRKQHPLAQENFYGSWEEVNKTFVSTTEIPNDQNFHSIQDSFKIVGNPRNEKKYYGPLDDINIDEQKVREMISFIHTDIKWMKQINEKIQKSKLSLNQQIRADAIYVLKEERLRDTLPCAWRRNPRVGKYSFVLVVCDEETANTIPESVANISMKNEGNFIHPYFYFLYGPGLKNNKIRTIISEDTLQVAAHPDLQKGIYINTHYFKQEEQDTSFFREDCGSSKKLKNEAALTQYSHYIDPRFPLNNVALCADVQENAYTVTDYAKNVSLNKFIKTPVKNSCCPCKTVKIANGIAEMKTPASLPGQWSKENVGLATRHGFTYGKYIVKVKMPELLNASGLWNGLTNAIWLLSQSNKEWNFRRFSHGGYIPKEDDNKLHPQRKQELGYSEIDFELLKASHYWPKSSYPHLKIIPTESSSDADNIMVTYTNWDMANPDVKRFTMGADSIAYQGHFYSIHRWDQYYKALTGKHPEKDDDLFKQPYYYFQIWWKPNEIIWSIGPEKNKLHVVGYVNESVSSIPNNQMILVFTQEFHDAKWWPGSPFVQDRIPFPAKDIIGKIISISIE